MDSNSTSHGNGTDPSSMPLIVGLSVGIPLSLIAISAMVVAIAWWCSRSTSNFKSMEARANPPKTIEEYPPVGASSFPSATSDPIYENYQAGGSPHVGARSQPPGTKGQRNVFHGLAPPTQVDTGDTGIYANVPSTFPRRT